jgi:hypothetical protein
MYDADLFHVEQIAYELSIQPAVCDEVFHVEHRPHRILITTVFHVEHHT